MIFLYLIFVIGISIYEINDLHKKKFKKDIWVFIGCMFLVAVVGCLYLANTFQPSLADNIMSFLNVKG